MDQRVSNSELRTGAPVVLPHSLGNHSNFDELGPRANDGKDVH
jgi:hypothetical protein